MPIATRKHFRRDAHSIRVITPMIVFSLISLSGFSSCRTDNQAGSQSVWDVIAPVQAMLNQETEMIETVQKLCQLLSTEPLTAPEVATSLGTIVEDPGKNLPLIVRPSNPFFKEAQVVRQFETNEPAHVELLLAEPGALSVEALKATFGDYSEPPKLHWNSPQKIIFYVNKPNLPRTCAVIADVRPGEQGAKDGTVTAVTVRRDIRLE